MAKTLSQKTRSRRLSMEAAKEEASASLEDAKLRLTDTQKYLDRPRGRANATELFSDTIKALVCLIADRLRIRILRRGRAEPPDSGGENRLALRTTDEAGREFAEACSALQKMRNDLTRALEATCSLSNHAVRRHKDIRLVGSIMSAQVSADGEADAAFGEFERLFAKYMDEARDDDFPPEAEAYAKLLLVKSKLSRIRLAPSLSRKNMVAVAGGFSSGKSSFINSLIDVEPGVLPTRITPTTSIPTFVLYYPDRSLEIVAFNKDGGKQLIGTDTLSALTHDFERDYGIPLKKIVDGIVVSTPNLESLDRIAFVDTPGYSNPEGEGAVGRDKEVALTEILSAHFLVWIIDCERGALSEHDLYYLKYFMSVRHNENPGSPPVYIAINKADKKPSDQQEEILDGVTTTAKKHGIECAGVGLYSAHEKHWYSHNGKPFQAFLDEINQIEPSLTIKDDVATVLDRYIDFHETEVSRHTQHIGFLKRLGLLVDDQRKRERRIGEELEQAWKRAQTEVDRHKRHSAAYRSLHQQFADCMDRFTKALEASAGV